LHTFIKGKLARGAPEIGPCWQDLVASRTIGAKNSGHLPKQMPPPRALSLGNYGPFEA